MLDDLSLISTTHTRKARIASGTWSSDKHAHTVEHAHSPTYPQDESDKFKNCTCENVYRFSLCYYSLNNTAVDISFTLY